MTSKCLAEVNGNNKTTSQRKVEANRRNAQLSTGFTSAEGKKTGSRNASKHGLLVKDVVITNRGNKEDPAEFETPSLPKCAISTAHSALRRTYLCGKSRSPIGEPRVLFDVKEDM
jgi:hypothetical protein